MSFIRLYRYQDKLILPTVVQAEEGFYMDVEPVVICDIADRDNLKARLEEALTRENSVVPTPERSDDPGSAILERLKIRKWRKFEADATMFTIYLRAEGIEYYSTGKAVDGEWKVGRGKHISFPAETSNAKVVDLLLHELAHEVSNLDEPPKSGGLALLPPPAEH